MAVPDTFRDLVLEKLEPIGDIQVRAMFGGFGVFESGAMFALMAGSGLFFKVDESNRSTYEEAGSVQYGRMPYFRVPESVLEDSDTLQDWARASMTVSRASTKKRRK